jgi:putative DNA primase/helicase
MINTKQKIQLILDSARTVDFRLINQIESSSISLSRKHFIVGAIMELLRLSQELAIGIKLSEESVFIYNGMYWERIEKEIFIKFLSSFSLKIGISTTEAFHYQFIEELFIQFKSIFFDINIFNTQYDVKVNLQNGTCVFSANGIELKSFNENDNLKYILPFEYNANAECPKFDSYLKFVLPDSESRDSLAEFIGYSLVDNGTLKLEKVAILIGGGANGKSVFFDIISALLGKDNISHYSLKNLTEERGIYRIGIQGKLLNYSSELGKHLETTIFKQLASGEPVDARSLYKSPVTIVNYARLMFNTNEMPSDIEFNDGFMRRLMIIKFGVTIPDSMRDPNLSKSIIDTELSGVFNWALKGLERILSNKGFTKTQALIKELDNFKSSSDSVRQFIEEESFEKCLDNPLTLKTIYKSYRDYCFEYGYKPVSVRKFADRVRNAGFESERKNYGTVIYMRKTHA